MPKRGDNIHKRKDGRWEGRYRKGRKQNGTIQYGSVYSKTYNEVKKKLSEMSSEPQNISIKKSNERTFYEVVNLWMKNNCIRLKGGTINKYYNIIETHIKPELGKEKISDLSTTMINSFLLRKLQNGRLDSKGGLSASYVRSIMLIINATLKYAVDEQMCLPFKTPICKPATDKKELSVLSLGEQEKLERCLLFDLDKTKVGILIALHTGLRIGEICALAWDDVDLKEQVISVRHTVARVLNDSVETSQSTRLIIDSPKTRSSTRDIPISSVLLPILVATIENTTSRYVISNSDSFVSPRTLEYKYHRLLKESGVPPINFHALRHTFATRCIEAGVDVKSLSEMLGHANVGVTLNTYVHSSIELKRNQLEKLNFLSAK